MDTPLIEKPTGADATALVELFSNDLQDLNLAVDPHALAATATALINASESSTYVRVVRLRTGDTAIGVIVAHRWMSVKFSGPAYWIETLYVAPAGRRNGLGRKMVTELIDAATQNGCHGIDLEAYRMNAPAAYLYRALGFRRLGRERYSLRINI